MDYKSLVWVTAENEDHYNNVGDIGNGYSSDVDTISLPDLVSSDADTDDMSDSEISTVNEISTLVACPGEASQTDQLLPRTSSEQNHDRIDQEILPLEELLAKFKMEERKFNRACIQMDLLSAKLRGIWLRIRRAEQQKNRRCRYVLQLQYKTVHGVKEMFYHYATTRADVMDDLRVLILEAEGRSDSEFASDSETDSE